jgi:glutamyl-Q tRNA(Asp) synthetase
MPGAADDILRTLEGFGLAWDGTVLHQSTRDAAYAAALAELDRAGRAFGCACTRKELAAANGLSVYPGTCRNGVPAGKRARSWRFRMAGSEPITWVDAVQGPQRVCRADVGDVVLRRADGLWAYHLAVVVDDLAQGVSDVVRGADLLEATAAHLAVYEALKGAAPRYAHLPVVTNSQGQKLSKQTLGQPEVVLDDPHRMLAQAAVQWDIRTVPQGSREGG